MMLGAHCIWLVFQTCLPLAFLASMVAAFKQALEAEQTTSTTSKWTSKLLMSNCLPSMPLEPQCMAVTLYDLSEPHGRGIIQYHLPILDP